MLRHVRTQKGSAITELGPALLVLFVLIFFPMLDIIGAACDFAFANLLHDAEIRELSVRVPNEAEKENIAQSADRDTIRALTGFAGFCGITATDIGNPAKIKHDIEYLHTDAGGVATDIDTVQVTTTVSFRPFLRIPLPLLPHVPGLSSDLPLKITSTKPQEEKGKNG